MVHHIAPRTVRLTCNLSYTLRLTLVKKCRNFSPASALADDVARLFGVPCGLLLNPYDSELFRISGHVSNRDIVFVGRLISEKGADILLDSLAVLLKRGIRPKVTIVGDGPQMADLNLRCEQLGLRAHVKFTGPLVGVNLARTIAQHAILVVPSRCKETFPTVVIEAIACGCVVVGSNGGGLPEAIGPCGATFKSGDVLGLAAVLRQLLENPLWRQVLRQHVQAHLARHHPRAVAQSYIEVLERQS